MVKARVERPGYPGGLDQEIIVVSVDEWKRSGSSGSGHLSFIEYVDYEVDNSVTETVVEVESEAEEPEVEEVEEIEEPEIEEEPKVRRYL